MARLPDSGHQDVDRRLLPDVVLQVPLAAVRRGVAGIAKAARPDEMEHRDALAPALLRDASLLEFPVAAGLLHSRFPCQAAWEVADHSAAHLLAGLDRRPR